MSSCLTLSTLQKSHDSYEKLEKKAPRSWREWRCSSGRHTSNTRGSQDSQVKRNFTLNTRFLGRLCRFSSFFVVWSQPRSSCLEISWQTTKQFFYLLVPLVNGNKSFLLSMFFNLQELEFVDLIVGLWCWNSNFVIRGPSYCTILLLLLWYDTRNCTV